MSVDVVLQPVGRLDVAHLLGFLGAHAVPGIEHWDGERFSRSLRSPSGPAVVQLWALGHALGLRVHAVERDVPDVLRQVRHLMALDDDSAAAEAALGGDPWLGPLVRSRPGLRLPGSVDHAETLVRTVIGQQVSVAGGRVTTGRVVALAGDELTGRRRDAVPGVTHLFPTPAALARLDPTTLPMPRARGRSVVAIGAALAADPGLIADDARLLGLPGVGPWTVALTRLRTRRDPDVFLDTDLGIRRQLEAMGLPADPASVLELSSGWAPHRSTALLHLWTEYLSTRRAA